jgi:large subunit ribosomal protein L3
MKFLFAHKEYMTEIFTDSGELIPVTALSVPLHEIAQEKSNELDGYAGLKVGIGSRRAKTVAKPQLKSDGTAYQYIREMKGDSLSQDSFDLSTFEIGQKITISGTSKGKGFQGGVKRHGFAGGRRTHGQKHSEREPGSIGVGGVQRVFKGQRMAGRMGADMVTVKNLTIAKVDTDNRMIFVKGAVPGRKGTLLKVRTTE